MKKNNRTLLAMALMCAIGVSACSDGDDGKDGADGADGSHGSNGTSTVTVDTVSTAADFILTVDPAATVVVGADDFTITFTATGKDSKGDDVPFTGLEKVALYVTNQMPNDTGTGAPMVWSNNAIANNFGSSMYCTPTGKAEARGGAEVDACTLVEDEENPGTYTGTWEHDGNAPVVSADGDPNTLFRVMVRTYDVTDSSGVAIGDKLLSTPVDFIPATGALAVSEKDSVSSAACAKCHSSMDGYEAGDDRIANIGAHHNYQKVENCVACHNPAYATDQTDPAKGWNANFNAMIHTIHVAGHVKDYGWVQGEALEEFGEVNYPAELNECTVCHDNGTQWNDNVYAEACIGCHLTVDLTTGTGHAGIIPADDTACVGCHGAGSLSPIIAHKVGNRAIEQEQVVLDFQDVAVVDNGDGTSTLTVTTNVTINGAVPADGTVLDPYISMAGSLLIGNIDSDGTPIRGLGMSVSGVAITGGVLTTTKSDADTSRMTGSIYVTADMLVCAEDGEAVECASVTRPSTVSASAPVKYFNLDDPTAAADEPRFVDPDRITITTDKCNACHENLTHVKEAHHGVSEITQCMDCHNNRYPGSYHGAVEYDTGTVDANGDKVFETLDGVTFSNRDLMTVAHRFHSGSFGGGIYLNEDLETVGYPALATDCQACHKDGAEFFAPDGGLTSGKSSIEVPGGYISPVAETCRTCHISESALAHFKSNGATVEGMPDTTADLPVESCATCHAEGKTYGVDVVHAGGSH
ncbi:OmcA/MtrC family decaheme c-type cytochrome [Shewanella sp. Isolate11]|uniref:OmcA/MtrC family decaheme c-type cytochrome n=1 Tax=Shewanella sp. Isolate11 TaxID=2908530 RepID=UPI001EFEB17E|nr:OmcA/MtrC family decaheme c-type cytochrome [Shewanella sp. Isolate11]MCG9695840.1 OmcA/MtrC family decaheme c-type cytochrome [Shewanella sp. Isolate11]